MRFWDIAASGYNICNSWAGVAATMYVGFSAGGSSTIIYGMVVSFFVVACNVLSLAELAARYPSAGGQYHWAWLVSPRPARRIASYFTGVVNIFAWVAIGATVCVIVPNFLFGIVSMNNGFVPQQWQLFLVYQATNLIVLVYNILVLAKTQWIHDIGFAFTLGCMISFWIACLAKATPKADSLSVWTTFVDQGLGWPRGIVFLIGMTNTNYMYAGIDGAIHLAEDTLNPASAVPWALVSTLLIGFITAFVFVVSMFYCINDPTGVASAPVPIAEIWSQALQSNTAATIMASLVLPIAFFSFNACQQTASRLTWSFGRDRGLVLSTLIGKIHPTLNAPIWALLANAFVVFVMGCVFLGDANAFNAILGTSLILMHASFASPVAMLMWSRRDPAHLPARGNWNMGVFGWIPNLVTVSWAVVITFFYCFPTTNPTTSSTMNYASVVLGVMAVFGLLNWFLYAKRDFQGPRMMNECRS